jgi:cathepsin D
MSGILGLAYGTISVDKLPTFVDSLSGSDKSFAFYLHSNPEKSYMTIPGYDEEAYEGEFTYHKVIHETYWALELDSVKVDRKTYDASKYYAIVDSGTSLLVGPQTIVGQFIDQLTVKEDCSNIDTLPDLTFTLSGTDYTLTGDDYVIQVTQNGETQCMLGLQGSRGMDLFILGDVFMRKYYTYFDKNQNRVGLALAASQ